MGVQVYSKTNIESTLFDILRSALGNGENACVPSMSHRQWEELFRMSRWHNVGAIVYEELKNIGCDIPSDIESSWKSFVRFRTDRFNTQLIALTKLAIILEAENVRMMVLKGVGISITYPKPKLREFNDIDIYCFDKFDYVNKFIASSGLDENVVKTEEKHYGFHIFGIEVENHCMLCNDFNHANRVVGKKLLEMASLEPYTDPRLPGIILPSPQMGALHLMFHTLGHLAWSGISLRHLLDITAYYQEYRNQIDFEQLRAVLKEAGIEQSAAVLLAICNRIFGLGMDLRGWTKCDIATERRVISYVFHPFKDSYATTNPFRKFHRKVTMQHFRNKTYRFVYGEKYQHTFLGSFACLSRIFNKR